jgi:hypothetical protein
MEGSVRNLRRRWGHRLAHLAIGAAVASFAFIGMTKADSDGIINTSKVPVPGSLVTCSSVVVPGAPWTPSAFSFDISWIDKDVRAYFLADRSHAPAVSGGNPNGGGDVMMINIDAVSLTGANALNAGTTYLIPTDPTTGAPDPMAGIACDQNTAFGGTSGVGRNEITGPNGAFTVNHAEIWVGDGPSYFQPGQGDGTVTMSAAGSCGVAGVTCSYSGTTADYAKDPCDSSVRVFNLASGKETDHINTGGCFRTDEGSFDPVDQVALIANPSEQPKVNSVPLNQSAFINFISTRPVAPGEHHKILKQINLDGTHGTVHADMGIEQSVYSEKTGMFYLNIPGASSNLAGYVLVIDPRDRDDIRIVDIYKLQPQKIGGVETYCAPTGGALGPDYEMLLGCSNSGAPEEVIDIRDGQVIKVLTGTSGGCDEVAFNPGDDHFLGACTDSTAAGTDDLDISDALPPNFDQAINTNTKGAHSVTADPVTVSDWQPAASGTGANAGPPAGLCGATPCVLIYKSTGGDDPSEYVQEQRDGHQFGNHW